MNSILVNHKRNQSIVEVQTLSSNKFGSESEYTINIVRFFNQELKRVSYHEIDKLTQLTKRMIIEDYNQIVYSKNSEVYKY